jgi:hypothetical protein
VKELKIKEIVVLKEILKYKILDEKSKNQIYLNKLNIL